MSIFLVTTPHDRHIITYLLELLLIHYNGNEFCVLQLFTVSKKLELFVAF